MQEDICVQETPVMVTPIKPYKMIATRGVVVFPGDTVSFEIIRDKSLAALQKASESGEDIFVVSQKHSSTVKPAPKDIYRVGTLVKILKIVKLPSEAIRVSVLGIKRMEIESYSQISPYFEVQLVDFSFPEDPIRLEAAKRVAFDEYELYKKSDGKIPSEIAASITPYEPERFLSAIAAFVFRKDSDKQNLLQMHTVADQLTFVSKYIAGEAEIIAVEKKIAASVRDSVAKGQKEFYLREQIRAIKKELGEDAENLFSSGKAKKSSFVCGRKNQAGSFSLGKDAVIVSGRSSSSYLYRVAFGRSLDGKNVGQFRFKKSERNSRRRSFRAGKS